MDLVPSDRGKGVQIPVWRHYQSTPREAGCLVSCVPTEKPEMGKGQGPRHQLWEHPLTLSPRVAWGVTAFRLASLFLPGAWPVCPGTSHTPACPS